METATNKDISNYEFWYPRHGNNEHLEIALVDIRSSDGIRVSYDFDRDGWKIEQPLDNDEWAEVVLIPSWQLRV